MSLRLVYGRAGSGKSYFCFQEIAKRIQEGEKIYMITPEQFSYTAEKKLLEAANTTAVLSAEVITFQRMAYRVMQEVGGRNQTTLSDIGKSMLVYYLLGQKKKKFTFLGKSDENLETIKTAITEFKKHQIKPEKIKEILEQIEDPYLAKKLEDMALIYSQYQKQIEDKYIDENDILTKLEENIEKWEAYKGATIYLDEFSGFTEQEYALIRKLLLQAKQVTITITSDSLEEANRPETDIFYDNKKTIGKLLNLAKENNITLDMPVYLGKLLRFQNKELQHIEQNMYQIPYHPYPEKVEHMHLFLAANPYSEIEEVAKQIVMLVNTDGYQYHDIGIITKNMDAYSSLAKAIFREYEIPVFIDEKRDLSQNILMKYILSIFDIFAQNWSYEAMFAYIKSGLVQDLEQEDIFKLENYCIQWGIKGKKWYQEDWKYGIIDEKNEKEIEYLNQVRRQIIGPLLELKTRLTTSKTVQEMTKSLYQYLIDNQIPEQLEQRIEEMKKEEMLDLANAYEESWKVLIHVLDELVLTLGDEKVGFDNYNKLLKVGLNSSSLATIPGTQDQVILGDVDRSRSHPMKAVFIIGLNDGAFPSNNKEEGFFNDTDRTYLKEKGMELAKGTIDKLYEDNFNIYKAFMTPERELYLSYTSSDNEGKSQRPSILISKIKKLFPSIVEESDVVERKSSITRRKPTFEALLEQLRALSQGEEIDPIWYGVYEYFIQKEETKERLKQSLKGMEYSNLPEIIKPENIEKLYGKTLQTSISRLEKYQSCPFSFYLKYGLKLKEQEHYQVKMVDTGSFMHDIIDTFFETVAEEGKNVKEIDRKELEKIIEDIIQEKLALSKNYIFTSSAKFRNLTRRLKKVILKSIQYIIESLKISDFNVYGTELEFKDGKEYPAIKLTLEDGKRVEITGKIDRVDIAKNEDGTYLRIIDYKSSVKSIDLNEVMAGLQIQLLTYLDAVTEKVEDSIPAGILYFNLIDPILKADRNKTDEEITAEMKKKFKMNGYILADVKVAKMMDKGLESGSSSVIPAYLDKSGNLSKAKSNAISREEFENLEQYIKKLVKQISREILTGKIELKPYYNPKNKKTPCEYCEYKAICQFNPRLKGNCYRYIGNLDKNAILGELKGKEKDKERTDIE
ncbi:MAG: helicase-exonuclease AddAB subunit AddB [Clostridia bacterium]